MKTVAEGLKEIESMKEQLGKMQRELQLFYDEFQRKVAKYNSHLQREAQWFMGRGD